jgi:glycosyltransferase involved in cell wall biosynthesis
MRFGLDGIPLRGKKSGIGHYTLELARALAALVPEHEFEIVSPGPFSSLLNSAPNLHFTDAHAHGLKRRFWWPIGLPLYCRRASFALFHGTNFDLPYWTTCPTVLTIHDLSLLLFPQTHEKHLVRRARRVLPMMVRKATAIITPSETVKREVCEHLEVSEDKVFAIPEAARACFYPAPSSDTEPVRQRLGIQPEFILFVGTVEPRKNLLTLARAFEQVPNTQLVIAGQKGWLSDDLMAYLDESEIRDRVLFTGHLSDDDLRALYSSCRVFVYPSLYEGFGLPLLEAMACGASVVTSNVGSILETVGDAARLVSPTDAAELAHAITALLNNTREREHLSVAGINHAKQFSWEKTAAATWKVYQQALSSHKKAQKAQRII